MTYLPTVLSTLLTLSLLAPLGSAGNRWVVDQAGGGDFTELQQAVDAAVDQDAIIVLAGSYGAVTVDGKALTIAADDGALVQTGTLRLLNLTSGKTLSVAGILASGMPSSVMQSGLGLQVLNCAGSVRLRDCEFRGAENANPELDAWAGVSVEDCDDVGFFACSLLGSAHPQESTTGTVRSAGDGLVQRDSRVALYGCVCEGGTSCCAPDGQDAAHGGYGARVSGQSEFFASECVFTGGTGGGAGDCGYPGFGGHGLWSEAPVARVLGCAMSGGAGGGCVPCLLSSCIEFGPAGDAVVGAVTELPGSAVRLLAERVTSVPGHVQLYFYGVPGQRAHLLPSPGSDHEFSTRWGGVLMLSTPLVRPVHSVGGGTLLPTVPLELESLFLGVVPESGPLVVSVPLDAMNVGIGAEVVHLQGMLRTPGGEARLTDAVDVLVTDCTWPALDCNSNGTPDGCDVLTGASNDCGGDGIPDECQTLDDCDNSGVPDLCEIEAGTSLDCNDNGVPDSCELAFDCNGNGVPDNCDIGSGVSLDCDENSVPDECESLPDCNSNGVADPCDITAESSMDTNGNHVPDECEPTRLHVDASAPAGGDGSSWASALRDLHDALDPSHLAREVWVRAGVYRSSGFAGHFDLPPGFRVYGGFAGWEDQLSQRDLGANVTVLSGDVLGDDGPNFTNRADNTFTVVRILNIGKRRLDGFTIRGGEAMLESDSNTYPGYLTAGGGICATTYGWDDQQWTVANCTIVDNRAKRAGGGLFSDGGNLRIINCKVLGNEIGPTSGPTPGYFSVGGGVGSWLTELEVIDSVFTGNRSMHVAGQGGGGALFATDQERILLSGVSVYGNHSTNTHGGVLVSTDFGAGDGVRLEHLVIWGNTDSSGSTFNAQLGGPDLTDPLWSCIQHLPSGFGVDSIGLNPLFVNPLGADGLLGTIDDDLRLAAGSPCIDAGRNALLPTDSADIDSDENVTEQLPYDLAGNARRIDDPQVVDTGLGLGAIVDMGALERVPDGQL